MADLARTIIQLSRADCRGGGLSRCSRNLEDAKSRCPWRSRCRLSACRRVRGSAGAVMWPVRHRRFRARPFRAKRRLIRASRASRRNSTNCVSSSSSGSSSAPADRTSAAANSAAAAILQQQQQMQKDIGGNSDAAGAISGRGGGPATGPNDPDAEPPPSKGCRFPAFQWWEPSDPKPKPDRYGADAVAAAIDR